MVRNELNWTALARTVLARTALARTVLARTAQARNKLCCITLTRTVLNWTELD